MGQGFRFKDRDPALSAAAQLDQTLAALADPYRRQAIERLRERPYPAGELARSMGLTPPAMSRHLRAMKQAGLVEETHPEFDARVRVYALKAGAIGLLLRWLQETEDMWSSQLSALKSHVEGKGL